MNRYSFKKNNYKIENSNLNDCNKSKNENIIIQGNQGPIGPQGDRGLHGPKGDSGIEGLKGEKGLKGNIGNQGKPGETGLIGQKGQKGIIGDRGEIGPRGANGGNTLIFRYKSSQITDPDPGEFNFDNFNNSYQDQFNISLSEFSMYNLNLKNWLLSINENDTIKITNLNNINEFGIYVIISKKTFQSFNIKNIYSNGSFNENDSVSISITNSKKIIAMGPTGIGVTGPKGEKGLPGCEGKSGELGCAGKIGPIGPKGSSLINLNFSSFCENYNLNLIKNEYEIIINNDESYINDIAEDTSKYKSIIYDIKSHLNKILILAWSEINLLSIQWFIGKKKPIVKTLKNINPLILSDSNSVPIQVCPIDNCKLENLGIIMNGEWKLVYRTNYIDNDKKKIIFKINEVNLNVVKNKIINEYKLPFNFNLKLFIYNYIKNKKIIYNKSNLDDSNDYNFRSVRNVNNITQEIAVNPFDNTDYYSHMPSNMNNLDILPVDILKNNKYIDINVLDYQDLIINDIFQLKSNKILLNKDLNNLGTSISISISNLINDSIAIYLNEIASTSWDQWIIRISYET